MNRIYDLIREKCPNGVKNTTIEKVIKSYSTGLNPRQNFKLNDSGADLYYVTVKEITSGKIVFSKKTDLITKDAWNKIQFRSKLEMNDILVSGIGTIGKIALVDISVENWNCSESVILLKPDTKLIDPKYFAHLLRSNNIQKQWKTNSVGSTLKGLRKENVLNTKIALPPIEIQKEIVIILDKFEEFEKNLELELESELKERKKQYEFWCKKLFSFNENVNYVELDSLAKILTKQTGFDYSNHIKPILKDYNDDNSIPYIQTKFFTGKKFDYSTDYYIPTIEANKFPKILLNEKCILLSIVGASIGNIGLFDGNTKSFLGGAIGLVKFNENVNIDYIYHYLSSPLGQRQIKNNIKGTGQASLTIDSIRKFIIPFPSEDEQKMIVRILDKFDNLVSDISESLPLEIELRKQQYEYYCNRLLSFEELIVSE